MWRGVGLAVPLKKIGVPRQLLSRNECFRVMSSCGYYECSKVVLHGRSPFGCDHFLG